MQPTQALEEAGFQTQLDALVSSDAGLQSQLAILFGQPAVVNCPTDSIIAALAAGYTQIEFTGTCAGDIVISARGVMIAGTGATTGDNVVKDNITVRGGIGVDLTNFTVDGNGNPIAEVTVLDGSFIRLTGMDLNAVGLTAQRNSGALVIDSPATVAGHWLALGEEIEPYDCEVY